MEMAELMKMIKERQGEMSTEEYANQIGIRGATLWRYYNTPRKMSLNVLRRLAKFYNQQGDTVMLKALGDYALGNGTASSQQ